MTQSQQPPDIPKLVNEMLDRLGDEPAIATIILFNVKRPRLPEFQAMADVLTRATQKLLGCEEFSFNRHIHGLWETPAKPGIVQYAIYERWESVGRFRHQWNSTHLREFQGKVVDLLDSYPDLRFYCDVPDADTATAVSVLQTGQMKCWNETGEHIPCQGTGQDGYYKAGVTWPRGFTPNGDGTVTDERSGLTWLQDADFFHEVSWPDALRRAGELCDGMGSLCDGSEPGDWRLPNANEFQSLVDLSNTRGAAIPAKHPFDNVRPVNYWTCSSVALAPALGWYVALGVAPPVFDLKGNLMHMWPVKGESAAVAKTGQTICWGGPPTFAPLSDAEAKGTRQDGDLKRGRPWPSPRFVDNDCNGTVTDRLTGLIWLKHADAFGTLSWQHALDACNSLTGDTFDWLNDDSESGDWRLPNVHELRSLIDYDHHTPALPVEHAEFFTHVRPSLYWSSTTVASAPNLARFVFIGVGPSVWDHKSVLLGVWPVKGGR